MKGQKIRVQEERQGHGHGRERKRKSGQDLEGLPGKRPGRSRKSELYQAAFPGGGKTSKGGIIEKEAPVHVSNLMLICGKCTDPVRVGRRRLDDGKTVRVCKKCGEILENK